MKSLISPEHVAGGALHYGNLSGFEASGHGGNSPHQPACSDPSRTQINVRVRDAILITVFFLRTTVALTRCPVNRQTARCSGHPRPPAPHTRRPRTHAGPAQPCPQESSGNSRALPDAGAPSWAGDVGKDVADPDRGWPPWAGHGLGHGPLQPPPCPSPQEHAHLPCSLKSSHTSKEWGAFTATAFASGRKQGLLLPGPGAVTRAVCRLLAKAVPRFRGWDVAVDVPGKRVHGQAFSLS